jgi:Tfp pilus assembly protein PilO
MQTLQVGSSHFSQKYNTISEIKNEGEKLKSEIDKTVSTMVIEIRELEEEELHKITSIIAGLKKQLPLKWFHLF